MTYCKNKIFKHSNLILKINWLFRHWNSRTKIDYVGNIRETVNNNAHDFDIWHFLFIISNIDGLYLLWKNIRLLLQLKLVKLSLKYNIGNREEWGKIIFQC